jgi:hypothetical protein
LVLGNIVKHILSACALALFVVAPASAQEAVTGPALAIQPPAQTPPMLRTGTRVQLRLLEQVTTKNKVLRVGQRIRMETSETVLVDGVNVIPIGSPAIAEVVEVRNKGMWGKSGHFTLRAVYLTVNGRQIRIGGTIDDKGVAGGWGAAAVSAIVFLPAGFFMTGTSAVLPAGTAFSAFVEEDVPLSLPNTQPAALMTNVSATQVASASGGSAIVSIAQPQIQSGGPAKLVAKTPSGFCLDVPKGYAGTGSMQRPVTTNYLPACWTVAD